MGVDTHVVNSELATGREIARRDLQSRRCGDHDTSKIALGGARGKDGSG